MHALPNSTVDLIARWPLGFVATIDAEGRPAVSPKGTFLVLDDATIGFANIRSPGTTANLKANPEVEVNFIDFITRKGARLRGKAAVMSSSTPAFETHLALWQAAWPTLAPRITDLILITVTEVKPLTTPPYDDGATEEDMVALYKAKIAEMYP